MWPNLQFLADLVTFTGEVLKGKLHFFVQWLREKCPYSEFFCSIFSHIWTEYEKTRSISPYSVQIQENMDQENSQYGHFLRSDMVFSKTFNGVLNSFCLFYLFQSGVVLSYWDLSKPAFTCTKSTMETTKKCVKSVES